MSSPMQNMIDHLLDSAEKPGETIAVIQFKAPVPPVKGALRRAQNVKGAYELMSIATFTQNGPPTPVSNFFTAEDVCYVMKIHPEESLPKIVAPPSAGGIIIPS